MGLLSWYKLDGDAIDSWGDSDGTIVGSVTFQSAVIEEGMRATTQTNRYITTMTSPFTTQTSFSIAGWVYIPSSYTWNTLSTNGIIAAGSYAGGHGLVRQANVDNSIGMYIRTTTQTRLAVTPITRDTWYHIVGIFNAIDQELKIYKDGILIDTTATTFPNESLDASVFNLGGGVTLGGNADPNRYFEGDIDDVRFFDHALSYKEVKKLSQAKIFHLKLDGDATDCSMYEHNGTVDGGILSDGSAIGSGSWAKVIDADDIATSLLPDSQNLTYSFWFKTTGTGGTLSEAVLGNRSSSNGFMFYRNDGNTDTQFHALKYYTTTTPSQANILRTSSYTADTWHHIVCAYDENGNYKIFNNSTKAHYGTATLFDYWDDGVTFDVGHDGAGGYVSYRGWVDDIQIFNTYLSDADCIALYEERASLDNEGNLHGVEFVETKYQPFLTNYTVWADGQTGSVGSFAQNGTTAENSRNNGTDPFGNTVPIWKATPDAVSGPDGGWNHAQTTADKTKCYRYSVWIKRTGTNNGTTYLGCKHSHVKNIVTSVVDANPYFRAGDPSNYTDWFLHVGHIRPHDTDETTHHPDTGIWNTDGVKVQSMTNDYKWIDGAVVNLHRTYLYYCTLTTNRQYWAYPRIDVCDGTEPTLADLIGGLDGRQFDYVNSLNGTTAQPMSVTSSQVLISNMSEVGTVEGLVAWYPLNGDAVDIINGNDGTVTGATKVTGVKKLAYDFNGSSDKILVGNVTELNLEHSVSVCAWIKATDVGGLRTVASRGYAYMINAPSNGVIEFYAHDGVDATGGSVTWNHDDEWIHLALVVRPYTDGWTLRGYVNGDLVKTVTTTAFDGPRDTSETFGIGSLGGGTSRYFDGSIDEVRVYDRVLTTEEIKVMYSLGVGTGRMSLATNVLYVKEKFIEV